MTAIRTAHRGSGMDTDTSFLSQSWSSHAARAETRWGRSGAVVAVHGEIDAANAAQLADYVGQCALRCEWLVVDLSALEFMGTAGFAALQDIQARCTNRRVQWTLVSGAAASRVLRLCDPHALLPAAGSMAEALERVHDPRLLHLVPKPGQ